MGILYPKRYIHTEFHCDLWVKKQTQLMRYFYLYLLTNPRSSQCGIYEITIEQMAFDTDFTKEQVVQYIEALERDGKIKYDREGCEIYILNWRKRNPSTGDNVETGAMRDLKFKVKNNEFKQELLESYPPTCGVDYESLSALAPSRTGKKKIVTTNMTTSSIDLLDKFIKLFESTFKVGATPVVLDQLRVIAEDPVDSQRFPEAVQITANNGVTGMKALNYTKVVLRNWDNRAQGYKATQKVDHSKRDSLWE